MVYGVLCYLTGRISSLVEPVVNTIFENFRLWEIFGEKTLLESIGKASLEFVGVLKESMEWHSNS